VNTTILSYLQRLSCSLVASLLAFVRQTMVVFVFDVRVVVTFLCTQSMGRYMYGKLKWSHFYITFIGMFFLWPIC